MLKLVIRIGLAVTLAIVLATVGVKGNAAVLQTLFTVLGIVFSISMSLLVSFNLSKILNKKIREVLRNAIMHTRNMMLLDFSASTFFLVIALIWEPNHLRYELTCWCTLDVMLTAVLFETISLIYEIYNFRKVHKLHCDIEDKLIEEETNKIKTEYHS